MLLDMQYLPTVEQSVRCLRVALVKYSIVLLPTWPAIAGAVGLDEPRVRVMDRKCLSVDSPSLSLAASLLSTTLELMSSGSSGV